MADKNCRFSDQLISDIAQEIDMGMICFLNPDTLELESMIGNSDIYGDSKELNDEIYNKVNQWEKSIRIEPLDSHESFQIIEEYIERCIPDEDALKEELWHDISTSKPFLHFKMRIKNSQYQQSWFDFKQKQLEMYIRKELGCMK